MAMAFIEEG
jgi:hypothetical protein